MIYFEGEIREIATLCCLNNLGDGKYWWCLFVHIGRHDCCRDGKGVWEKTWEVQWRIKAEFGSHPRRTYRSGMREIYNSFGISLGGNTLFFFVLISWYCCLSFCLNLDTILSSYCKIPCMPSIHNGVGRIFNANTFEYRLKWTKSELLSNSLFLLICCVVTSKPIVVFPFKGQSETTSFHFSNKVWKCIFVIVWIGLCTFLSYISLSWAGPSLQGLDYGIRCRNIECCR